METKFLEEWEKFKATVQALESEASKTAKGQDAGSVRFRRGLRDLKAQANILRKLSTDLVAEKKQLKKSA